jgi:hypothetical protein
MKPTYMAIKKALYGRQPGIFISVLLFALAREYFLSSFILVSLL